MSKSVYFNKSGSIQRSEAFIFGGVLSLFFGTSSLQAHEQSVISVPTFTVIDHKKDHSRAAPKPKAAKLTNTLWGQTAARHGLDPYILYAVALIESGRIEGNQIRPWAWAVNDHGHAYYHSSKEVALSEIQKTLGNGRPSIDIGVMQINFRWHGKRVRNIETLIKPDVNIDLGATILSESIASAKGDLVRGIGRYHAWSNPSEAHRYGSRVLRLAERLRTLWMGG